MAKFPTDKVVKCSAYETAMNGYTKRSDDPKVECTADIVLDIILDHSVDEAELEKMNDRITAWSEYIKDPNQDSEYIRNVRAEVVKPMIDDSKIGLIASSFSAFDKHVKFKVAKERDKLSEFLGEEGDSIEFSIAEHKLVKSGASKYKKGAKWFLYQIKDNHGNIISYFSDHNCDKEFNEYSRASAIISKLTTYNEVKQTNVSKLRFE